mmetsp:Transcript_6683/g.19279  ORF Transcript_6683/g.19279 Transcript_6683/m.19279 type:complete len:380 (+) Transcript_6683:93-1232(+)
MQPTKHAVTTQDDEPILDPVLRDQLRTELYGIDIGTTGGKNGALETGGTNAAAAAANSKNFSTTTTGVGVMVMGASILGLVGMQFPFLFIKDAPFMATPSRKVQQALVFLLENAKTNRHSQRATMRLSSPPPSSSSLTSSSALSSALSSSSIRTSSPRAPRPPRQELPPWSSSRSGTTNANANGPPVFVDLGSGDGQAVYEAAKLGYRAVGIEFNWTLWALSSLRRRFFWSADAKRRSQFLLQDFSNYNLKDADTVMIFAVPRTMPILGQKIQSECLPGTTVMAYRFEMPLAGDDAGASTSVSTSASANASASTSASTSTTNGTLAFATANSEKSPTTTETNAAQDTETEIGNAETSDLRLRAKCIYDREEMRIYRMGE